MPRYFFDIHDGRRVRDEEGLVFPSQIEAKREAVRAAGSILRDELPAWNGEEWTMQVRDESDAIVATLKFSAS